MPTSIYRTVSDKHVDRFVNDFTRTVAARGFVVHNQRTMAMKETFNEHGQEMPDAFDLHMIQLCKPEKAAESLRTNLERAALMPKFVVAFSAAGKTQVRMLKYGPELVGDLLGDGEFALSMQKTYDSLVDMIEASV